MLVRRSLEKPVKFARGKRIVQTDHRQIGETLAPLGGAVCAAVLAGIALNLSRGATFDTTFVVVHLFGLLIYSVVCLLFVLPIFLLWPGSRRPSLLVATLWGAGLAVALGIPIGGSTVGALTYWIVAGGAGGLAYSIIISGHTSRSAR